MAKVVALIVLLSTIAFNKGFGYVKKHIQYPPYSKQLHSAIVVASRKTGIKLSRHDIDLINKIIKKEDPPGDLTMMYHGCYGLGQGKRYNYTNYKLNPHTTDPVEQVEMILFYVKERYKTFDRAWAHHKVHNWY